MDRRTNVGQEGAVLEPVTNQVTTSPGNGRRSATPPDAHILLACGKPTQRNVVRQNLHAW